MEDEVISLEVRAPLEPTVTLAPVVPKAVLIAVPRRLLSVVVDARPLVFWSSITKLVLMAGFAAVPALFAAEIFFIEMTEAVAVVPLSAATNDALPRATVAPFMVVLRPCRPRPVDVAF